MEQIDSQIQAILAYAMLFVLVATPVVDGIAAAARKFKEHAATTPTPDDDKVADKVIAAVEKVTHFLNQISAWVPVLRRGPKQ